MDPYLEDPGGWAGVHHALIAILRENLNGLIGPDFIADGDATVYILSPEERRWIYLDVFVVETGAAATARSCGRSITTPARVSLEAPEEVRQPYIVIRDRTSREVVTILEVLSPIHKAPSIDRAGYPGTGAGAATEFLRK